MGDLLAHHADRDPTRVAIHFHDDAITYRDLADHPGCTTAGLDYTPASIDGFDCAAKAYGAGGELVLGPTMESLEPWRGRLNVVSGLTLPAAYVGEATAGANHTRSSRCWLTCTSASTFGPACWVFR